MRKQVLFIIPVFGFKRDSMEYQGVGYIKSYLKEHAVGSSIHLIAFDEIEHIVDLFKDNLPMAVGFSMYNDNKQYVIKGAEIIKQIYPQIHIAIGGPQVIKHDKDILERHWFVDTIVSGEGEETFLELINRLERGETLAGCLGVTYREKNGDIVRNKVRPLIEPLDRLPFPDRSLFEKYPSSFLNITGSRGCLGRCTYCNETTVKKMFPGAPVRNRTAKNIVDEIEILFNQYHVKEFHFTDATFEDPGPEGRQKAEQIFDEIIIRKLPVQICFFTRSELINEESGPYLQKAHKAGVQGILIGIESGSNADLKLYGKKARVEDNIRALRMLRENGIFPIIGFINFHPYSTFDSLTENAMFLYDNHINSNFYRYLSKLEIHPEAVIKKKLIRDKLMDPKSDYLTEMYQYQFINPQIEQLHKALCMIENDDSQVAIDIKFGTMKVWVEKNSLLMEDFKAFDKLFKRVDEIREHRRQVNHTVFLQAIEMSRKGSGSGEIAAYCMASGIKKFDEEMINLYLRLKVKLQKENILV